jgi:hypothetical protein
VTTWPVQDLADAFLVQLATASGGPPNLAVYDGAVPDSPAVAYALVYFYIETPDGLQAPDASSMVFDSRAIDAVAYVHCVGGEPQAARAARAVAGRVRSALLDVTLTIPGWSCFPIRWREGQPPQRNEDTGRTVFDQVDVYVFRAIPG